jgi:hypothetical protein
LVSVNTQGRVDSLQRSSNKISTELQNINLLIEFILQWFSGDMSSKLIQRIKDVTALKNGQWLEDSGSLAHPIRPESYISMDNFYTRTVYEKGAEVTMHALLDVIL